MAEAKELTFQEVSSHNTKQDLYMVVHDKVYDCSSFVDEHPGGEEVLLDVGGQEATEAFEDVGHSDEARELLDGMFVANLKRVPGDPEPSSSGNGASSSAGGGAGGDSGVGVGLYAVILIGGAIAYGAYQYLQANAAANGEGQQ